MTPAPSMHPLLHQSCFVTGTDTGVGKTWVSVQLLHALAAAGHRVAGMKPVAAGAELTPAGWRNDDALALQAAGNVALPYELLNPVCLPRATSPHLAALTADPIDTEVILSAYESIRRRTELIVVEGAGGWFTPIGVPAAPGARGPTMEDLVLAMRLPVVLVVGIRLGALNHALLTADAILRSGAPLLGWVANAMDPAFADVDDYVDSLQQRLPAPLLWRHVAAS